MLRILIIFLFLSKSVLSQEKEHFLGINKSWESKVNNTIIGPTKSLNTSKYYIDEFNVISEYQIDYSNRAVVDQYIEKYKSYSWFPKVMGLFRFYEPMIEAKMIEHGIPIELKYLAIVESNMNPRAGSQVGAKGLWQFMPPTAKEYDLEWNEWVDLRYDPVASTDSACRYLKMLYRRYGDWNLVLSAYNWGMGNVDRLVRQHGKNYWTLRKYMPRETRAYAPSFMAVSYLSEFSHKYWSTIPVIKFDYSHISLTQTKTLYKAPNTELFRFLNPHLQTEIIPVGAVIYTLNQ